MGRSCRLAGLVVAVCVSSIAVAEQPGAAAPASEASSVAIDPRWGVLGEVAERDFTTKNLFTLGSETVIAFRWAVPNQEMVLHYLGPTRSQQRLKLDPATGEIMRSWKNLLGTTKVPMQANGAGDIVWAGSSSEMMFLRKNPDGSYWVRWDPDNKQTLTPVSGSDPALQQRLAEAGIEPGKSGQNRAVDAKALAAAAGTATTPKLAAAAAAPVSLPEFPFLEAGELAQGSIDTPGATDCYFIETKPGQKLMVSAHATGQFDSFLVIGSGSKCDRSIRMYARNDDFKGLGWGSLVEFVAGGGTYIVQVSGTRKTTGNYELAVTEWDLARGKLPPGMPIARVALPQFADGVSASTAPPGGTPAPAKGSTVKDCAECPELVVVPAGSFMMGSSAEEEGHIANEGPRHMVRFARPFAIGKYEVTFDEWDACVKEKACGAATIDRGWGRGRRPVLVSWSEAMRFVRWLRAKTGQNYYLPSESEWEYAARAGTQTPWNTGKALITDDANILNALGRTVPVGGYPANAFGLHDIHGNVSEWTADCYDVGYFGVPTDGGAVSPRGCKERVARDGNFSDAPAVLRSAYRRHAPQVPTSVAGFRIARSL